MKEVVIAIPTYKAELTNSERFSLERCKKVLSAYPIVFFCPIGLEASYLQGEKVEYFEKSYFEGIAGYNRLMLSPALYARFEAYQYMLVYQLDALVLKDELAYWCGQDLDYIGAAWIDRPRSWWKRFRYAQKANRYTQKLKGTQSTDAQHLDYLAYKRVGNGGFSLRKVQTFKNICLQYPAWIDQICEANIPEDAFWGALLNLYQENSIRIGTYLQGIAFAFEMFPSKAYKLNGYKLPFGCHDFEDWEPDFWQNVLKNLPA